jgi:Arc/MetJ family transcription regulator
MISSTGHPDKERGRDERQARSAAAVVCIFFMLPIHQRDTRQMRTNIVIDDELIAEAMKLSGARTKREAVENSLRLMVQLKRQEQVRRARGKLKWVGYLDAMRRD